MHASRTAALRQRHERPERAGEDVYPESDGEPMGETDVHRNLTIYLIEALKLWFASARSIYVSGDLMMYYVEGDPRRCVSPDVFVVKGIPSGDRRIYKLWEERPPCVVIEVSSRKTKTEDLKSKFELYRDVLKIGEYYIYDPLREYLPTRLRAWHRRASQFVERRVIDGRIRSPHLGLTLVDDGGMLRLVDPHSGRALPGLQEADAQRQEADLQRREAEAQRQEADLQRREAEARRQVADLRRREAEEERDRAREENRRLREELDKLRLRRGA